MEGHTESSGRFAPLMCRWRRASAGRIFMIENLMPSASHLIRGCGMDVAMTPESTRTEGDTVVTRVLTSLFCGMLFVGCSQTTDQASVGQGHGSHSAGRGGCMMMPRMSWNGGHVEHEATAAAAEENSSPARPPASDQVVKVYTCPMHPKVLSGKPGNCPQCGMRLVVKK